MKSIYLENNFYKKLGQSLFYLGIFFLPSAFSISAIFLIITSILGFFIQKDNYLKDKWNIPFLIATVLLITSSIINSLNNFQFEDPERFKFFESHLGLFNWIPFTLSFYGFQAYIKTKSSRRISALLFISGTVPVILSIIGQSLFNWHGPFQILNGFIIWYQRPIEGITAITGLFNNPNYLGSWLIAVWPFCLASFFQNEDSNKLKKIISLIFVFFIGFSIILCASRSAWLSLILSIPLFFGLKKSKFLIPILIFLGTLILSIFIPILGNNFQVFMKDFIPIGIWSNFSVSNYGTDISRLEIWQNALSLIAENPLFGSGFSSFPKYIESQTGFWKGHSHNLALELILSYGIPAGLCIIFPFIMLIKKAYKKIFLNKNYIFTENIFDKAWIIALTLLTFMHLFDIQYYDGRISITGWILLSGIRNIIKDEKIHDV